jgi:hypothetical protein
VPKQGNHENSCSGKMCYFEEFIAKVPVYQVSRVLHNHGGTIVTDRMVLWDAKVSHAWKISATMPVQ